MVQEKTFAHYNLCEKRCTEPLNYFVRTITLATWKQHLSVSVHYLEK